MARRVTHHLVCIFFGGTIIGEVAKLRKPTFSHVMSLSVRHGTTRSQLDVCSSHLIFVYFFFEKSVQKIQV